MDYGGYQSAVYILEEKKIREKVLSKAQEEVHCAVKLNFSSTRSA